MNNSNAREFPFVIIDGVFFQLSQKTGIARVWNALLSEWSKTEFAKNILVLDRDGTAPKLPGLRYRTIPRHGSIGYHEPVLLNSYGNGGEDAEFLQRICDEESADLFISTYYTTPISTPSIFMGYDMIPEMLGMDLSAPIWQEKRYGILHALHYITISASTAHDLANLFPYITSEQITVAHCGIESTFQPTTSQEIERFQASFNIDKPYILLVGNRLGTGGYKNSQLLFEALSQTTLRQKLAVVCVGGQPQLEKELENLASEIMVYVLALTDLELKAAYSGAVCLVYPSRYEGFGLPILEAMACGCPVITCRNSSIPEVAGDAAIYVSPDNPQELAMALDTVQELSIREELRVRGFAQARNFSWAKMSEETAKVIIQVGKENKERKLRQRDLVWLEFRRLQQCQKLRTEELQTTQAQLQTTQAQLQTTQAQLQATQAQLQTTQAQLQTTQAQLQTTQAEVEAMRSSKFWKMRQLWVDAKSYMGLDS
jgi:glycosyltransferase involved in cell wall biosynthesis